MPNTKTTSPLETPILTVTTKTPSTTMKNTEKELTDFPALKKWNPTYQHHHIPA